MTIKNAILSTSSLSTSSYDYDFVVFNGRFRPYHTGHDFVVKEALKRGRYVIINNGSIDVFPDERDPMTFADVREMILSSLTPEEADRVLVIGTHDQTTNVKWVTEVQTKVRGVIDALRASGAEFNNSANPSIALIGHKKDNSSYYLKLFPMWDSIAVPLHSVINATDIREALFDSDPIAWLQANRDTGILPMGTQAFLREWVKGSEYSRIRGERKFMVDYLKMFDCEGNRKFGIKPKFFTADNVIIQAGHIALVERLGYPCKGAWAVPGGHVEDDEDSQEAALREALEEMGIDVKKSTLRNSIKYRFIDDAPYRSTRGRTINTVTLVHLEPEVRGTDPAKIKKDLALPKLYAKSDAKQAKWFPIDVVLNTMRSQMMENHYLNIERCVDFLSTEREK